MSILCKFNRHDWQVVTLVAPIVLRESKTKVASEILDAVLKQNQDLYGKGFRQKIGGHEISIMRTELTGYICQESIEILESVGLLAKWLRNVYQFRTCARCGKGEEVLLNTPEASVFVNTLAVMLNKRLFTEADIIKKTCERNAAEAKNTRTKPRPPEEASAFVPQGTIPPPSFNKK